MSNHDAEPGREAEDGRAPYSGPARYARSWAGGPGIPGPVSPAGRRTRLSAADLHKAHAGAPSPATAPHVRSEPLVPVTQNVPFAAE